MNVVFEAVDPEDRSLRMNMLRKASRRAAIAHKLAGEHHTQQHNAKAGDVVKTPSSRSAELYAKHARINAMIDKHSKTGDARREAGYEVRRLRQFHRMHAADKSNSLNASRLQRMSWRDGGRMPKVDPESRQLRLSNIRQALKKAKSVASIMKKAPNADRTAYLKQTRKVDRIKGMVARYAPGVHPLTKQKTSMQHRIIKTAYKNTGNTVQKTVEQRGYDINGKPIIKTTTSHNAHGKIDNIRAFIPKKSKVDRATREARLKAILRSADAHQKGHDQWVSGFKKKANPGAASSVKRKTPGPDGTMHTADRSPRNNGIEQRTAYDFDLERHRRHVAVAKFISTKAKRKGLTDDRARLRKGYATLKKRGTSWEHKDWPLHKQGFTKYRKPE